MTTFYTDGACIPNPGPGASAYIAMDTATEHIIKRYAHCCPTTTTNNRMELTAIIDSIDARLPQPWCFFSDSQCRKKQKECV